ncbi:hypothetical protein ScPMuIL_018109 [Solemya velum]
MADSRTLEVVKEDDEKETRVVLVGECTENHELEQAVKKLGLETFKSETGLEYVHEAAEFETIFVLSSFEGEVYHKLHRAEARLMGPPILMKCARNGEKLPYATRPQYCHAMQGLVVCFSGFKEREELCYLVDLVHHMAGSVRKDVGAKVTHLVANCTGTDKYKFSVSYGTPIMSQDWIRRIWADRELLDARADSDRMMQYKVLPFFKCQLSFLGFSKEEQKHMEDLTIENGGKFVDVGDENCTHMVIDEHSMKVLPADISLARNIVRGEWFWGCIQMEACADESMYTFQEAVNSANRFTPANTMCSKSRKRKRLKENIAQLASEGDMDMYAKRRSSEYGGISMSPNSFLDASNTPDKSDLAGKTSDIWENKPVAPPVTKVSKRLQVVTELLQTERNYVGILHTIIHTFKAQIEKPDQYNGPLLPQQDVKLIFGKITPIYEVHCKIREELSDIVENWREERCVGNVISQHAEALVKAYPPFVNCFEQAKETIIKCDKSIPRFHAFLKVCLTKPECGRQSLTELLIRPVQRLPSIMLLLSDILKQTSKNIQDFEKLERAINVLKEVMTHINEDRRKVEGQVVMFDIINDIDNCPAYLLSSHRQFVMRIDVIELSNSLCDRGTPLSLFLFTDSLELCKRRTKVLNAYKSPASYKTPQKAYKHLEMLPLSSIRRILDFTETEDCQSAFGIISKSNSESKEKLYSFMLDTEGVNKSEFITNLSKSIANSMCRTDYENLVAVVEGQELQISTAEISNNTLSKAARFGKRVSRAFSFNKTPGKLKRAVSSVAHTFSPFVKDSRYTPRGDLRGKRLASSIDLTSPSSPLGAFDQNSGVYDDSDTISLGAYSLKDPME